MNRTPLKFEFSEVAKVWTGDANRKCPYLRETGILGSIRWWFEAVVRGYGGYACDPRSKDACNDAKDHCAVCELFGCTNWSAKFRFSVEKNKKNNKDITITMVFNPLKTPPPSQPPPGRDRITMVFNPLKTIKEEEEFLLKKTLWIISKYGSIGGRTTRRPSEDPKKQNEEAHKDYGLIKLVSPSEEELENELKDDNRKNKAINYLKGFKSKEIKDYQEYPNLKYFIFGRCKQNKYLNKTEMEEIMNRFPWLKGIERREEDPGKSKFLFSFYEGRWWCYYKADNDGYEKLWEFLKGERSSDDIKKGEEIL